MEQKTDNNRNKEINEGHNPPNAGRRLQQIREEKSISIEYAAEETKISTANIQAMENEDFARLPAAPFLKGQLIIYCRFLEIEDETIVNNFLTSCPGNTPKQAVTQRDDKNLAEPIRMSSITIALLILGAIIVSLTAFCLYTSWNPFL
jgi:cytoskeletal protein RodZ